MWQIYLLQIIRTYLSEAKKRNSHSSLRSLAKKCQISPGTLSELASGKKNISRKIALRIIPYIGLNEDEQINLISLIESDSIGCRIELSGEQNHLIENWHAFAILNLFELKQKPKTLTEVAQRLNLSIETVKKTVADLTYLGLLNNKNNQIFSSGKHWKSSDEISSDTIKKSHRNGIEAALKALDEVSLELRDFTSIIFPANLKQLKKIKIEIRKFLEKTAKHMAQGELDSVYKMNIQLFPLDKRTQN